MARSAEKNTYTSRKVRFGVIVFNHGGISPVLFDSFQTKMHPSSRFLPLVPAATVRRSPALALCLALVLFSTLAWAKTHQVSGTHITDKSPREVWEVLSAYDATCDSGCRYHRDDLVEQRKLPYEAKQHSFYTWTHLSTPFREVKYFTHVALKENADGFVLLSRQLDDSDAEVIAVLEEKTGLRHSPAFDSGTTHTTVKKMGDDKTQVTQSIRLVSSGLLALWGGKIEKEAREDIETTFKNIDS